jgi:hypothetical protein
MSMRSLFSACAGIVISCLLLSIPAACLRPACCDFLRIARYGNRTSVGSRILFHYVQQAYGLRVTEWRPRTVATTSSSWSADQMTITITRLIWPRPYRLDSLYVYLNHPCAPIPAITFATLKKFPGFL